jgi:phosphoribosylamine--glycine ligase
MGAYSPAPVVTPAVEARVLERIVAPTIAGLAAEGMPYRGFLYAGLMIDAAGDPRVVEFNCRFGDPEAQPVLARLETDLVQLCLQAARGRLEFEALSFDARTALGVVLAAEGYPGAYEQGDPISGLDDAREAGTLVFHAGTARDDAGHPVTSGGRVLCVVGLGDSVTAAAERAYAGVGRIRFRGMRYRRDIGHRAIAREAAGSDR